jgi:type III polyketide synthase
VGCAGGLSALRAAADIAAAASQRGRPARILVMACELCSLFLRAELQAALQDGELHVGPALFSDGAAALVVCNGLAFKEGQKPVFELIDWGSMVVPDTSEYMSYDIEKNGMFSPRSIACTCCYEILLNIVAGMIATISKFVPEAAIKAIIPMFRQLRTNPNTVHKAAVLTQSPASSFDWAIHPGGASILQGAKEALNLADDHIRASLDVYKHYGNSSSPTVLIVLDKLRKLGEGRENVVATSFGPGLIIEMCLMKRCGHIAAPDPSQVGKHIKLHAFWLSLRACLSKSGSRKRPGVMQHAERNTGRYIPILR